jgi:hypothetical protein
MATQVLVNSGESLHVSWYIDGVLTDPDGTATTVTITRDSDGSAIVTGGAASQLNQGVYLYSLQPQSSLDKLTVVWSATFNGLAQSVTTYVDIVGGYFVTLNAIRTSPNMPDISKFTTEKLIEARQWFETLAENYCGQAFVPRYKRIRYAGSGHPTLLADMNVRTIRSVRDYTSGTVYTAYTSDELADIDVDPVGSLTRLSNVWRFGTRNIEIVYEHGMDACPADMADAALDAIRRHLLENQTGRTVLSVADDLGGVTRYSTPGENRPTGYAEVDRVLNSYRLLAVG